jgi:hypothetical protein
MRGAGTGDRICPGFDLDATIGASSDHSSRRHKLETTMKICPVCNDSFADELNFCDIDGARLAQEGKAQQRNKWWSLLGAGLLVGALVISAASIVFLPKARVAAPVGSSEPPSLRVTPPSPATESVANVTAPLASSEPEVDVTETVVPDVKKKDKALANGNAAGAPPNPKAAAVDAEDADRKPSTDVAPPPIPKNPEPPPAVKSVSDTRPAEVTKPPAPPDPKKDQKATSAKVSDKDSNNKKKGDDKDKKKGGFLRVFKKIFGKD